MGLRDLEEDRGKGKKVREIKKKKKGPKDRHSHIGHSVFEGPSQKNFTFSIKETAEDDEFQSVSPTPC